MGRLANVTTKFCVSTLSQLWGQGYHRSASCWPQVWKSTAGFVHPKGVLHFLQEAGHVIDKGFDFYVYGISQMVQARSSSENLWNSGLVLWQSISDLKLDYYLVKIENKQKELIGSWTSVSWTSLVIGMGLTNAYLPRYQYLWSTIWCHGFKRQCRCYYEYQQTPNWLTLNTMNAVLRWKRRIASCLDIQTLGELDECTFDQYSYLIKDENRLKRARHVLENQRTLKAQAALQAGDLGNICRLMNASRFSRWSGARKRTKTRCA